MRRMMLLGALGASLLATPALADPGEARGWHDRERIERQINRDHDRSNRERDRHNRELDRRNRELDQRNRELDRAQNQLHRREAERDRKWYEHNRHDHKRHDHHRHAHRPDDRPRHYDFWTRERAWHHHHHHRGHWDTGVRFYVFENRRYVYHPYFAESDPFVRDEYGNCYRVEYHGDSRVLRQVRSKYCRWS